MTASKDEKEDKTPSFVDLKKAPQRSRRNVPGKTNSKKTLLTKAARGSNVEQKVKKEARAHSSRQSNLWDKRNDSSSSNVFSAGSHTTPDDDATARKGPHFGARHLRQDATSSDASAVKPKKKTNLKNVKRGHREPSVEKSRKTVKRTKVSSNELGVCCGKKMTIRSYFHEVYEKRPGVCCDKEASSPEDTDVEKVSHVGSEGTSTSGTYECPILECKPIAETSDADSKPTDVPQVKTSGSGIQNKCSIACSKKISYSGTQPPETTGTRSGTSTDDNSTCICDNLEATSAPPETGYREKRATSSSTQSGSRSSEDSCRLCIHEKIYQKAQSTSGTTAEKSLEKQGLTISDKKCTPLPDCKPRTTVSPQLKCELVRGMAGRSVSPKTTDTPVQTFTRKNACEITCPPVKSSSSSEKKYEPPQSSKEELSSLQCKPPPECSFGGWNDVSTPPPPKSMYECQLPSCKVDEFVQKPVSSSSSKPDLDCPITLACHRKPCTVSARKTEQPDSSPTAGYKCTISPTCERIVNPSATCTSNTARPSITSATSPTSQKSATAPASPNKSECKMRCTTYKSDSSVSPKTEKKCQPLPKCWKMVNPVSDSTSSPGTSECPPSCRQIKEDHEVDEGSAVKSSSPKLPQCQPPPKCWVRGSSDEGSAKKSSPDGGSAKEISPPLLPLKINKCKNWERPVFESPLEASKLSTSSLKTESKCQPCMPIVRPTGSSLSTKSKHSSTSSKTEDHTKKCQPLPKCWTMEDSKSKTSTTSKGSSVSQCGTSHCAPPPSDIKTNLCGKWCLKKVSDESDLSRSVSTPSPAGMCGSMGLGKPGSVQPGSNTSECGASSSHRPTSQSHKTASTSASNLCQPCGSQGGSAATSQGNTTAVPTSHTSDSSLPKYCASRCSTQLHKGSAASAHSKASLGTLSPITEPGSHKTTSKSHGSVSTPSVNYCRLRCLSQSSENQKQSHTKSPSVSSSGPSPIECCKSCPSSKKSSSPGPLTRTPECIPTATVPSFHKSTSSTARSDCVACLRLRATPAPKCVDCTLKPTAKAGSTVAEDSTSQKTYEMVPATCQPCGGGFKEEPERTKREMDGAPAASSCSPCAGLPGYPKASGSKSGHSDNKHDIDRMINEGSPAPSDVAKRSWERNTSKPTAIAPPEGSDKTRSKSTESEGDETSSGSSSYTESPSRMKRTADDKYGRGTANEHTQPGAKSHSDLGKKSFKHAPRMLKKKSVTEETISHGPFHQYAKIVLYRGNRSSQFRQKFKATVCNRKRYPSVDSQERELRGRINYRADPQIPVTSTHAEELRRQHVAHCRERMLEKLNKKKKHSTRFN